MRVNDENCSCPYFFHLPHCLTLGRPLSLLFCNAPQAVELILQLLRSPAGNGSLQKKTKHNITTEQMPQSVVKQVMTL